MSSSFASHGSATMHQTHLYVPRYSCHAYAVICFVWPRMPR